MLLRFCASFLGAFWAFILSPQLEAVESAPQLPDNLRQMIAAPLSPLKVLNPRGGQLLFLERTATVPLEFLAAPWIGLGGVEIDTTLHANKRRNWLVNPTFFDIATERQTRVDVPKDRNISSLEFSPDGRWLALGIDGERGAELWLVDTRQGRARAVPGTYINDIFTNAMSWSHDSRTLMVASRVTARTKPKSVSLAPTLEEATGTKVPVRTYAHLLKSPADVEQFQYYASVQWISVRAEDATSSKFGQPGLYTSLHQAPGGEHFLVKRMEPPFSYAVPAHLFTQSVEVWDGRGRVLERVLSMPLAEDVPPEGERKGPRSVVWQPDHPARLLWLEVLDEGDPRKAAPFRDRLMRWDFPFAGQPDELRRFEDRVSSLYFGQAPDQLLVREFNPDSNRTRLSWQRFDGQAAPSRVVLAYDVKDAYQHPGRPITRPDARGVVRLVQDPARTSIFLEGEGRYSNGEKPFLDRLNLEKGEKERLFESDSSADYVEEFFRFHSDSTDEFLLSREARESPPNLWLYNRVTKERKAITRFTDAVPAMTAAVKKPLVFKRGDGLLMSGTLYLPPKIPSGQKLAAMVWAYPEEYRSASVAGQVRVSDKRYSRPPPTGVQWLVTQGYAVLDNASMPLIGDKDSVNDTFVQQLSANARAVVDALDSTGSIDRRRIAVGGHSYGAFMTANLLAHTQLFCAGVARSGAYNRSLTPFGFQSERRTFWEAKDFYMEVSPFYHAEKIKTPLLLIHGRDDNNPGTLPMQTERLFHALRGIGGVARLVMLPFESHSYRSRENSFLTQAETLSWLERWCPAR